MKTLFLVFLALCTACAGQDRPNILFIYLDDFGWKDAGFMGSDFYETPHLDALARGGMVFTDAYSNSSNCAPARASLLSGQYSPRHRIFNVGTRPRGEAAHRRLMIEKGTSNLDDKIVTWAETLKMAGYRTGMFGKWHLGPDPTTQGFDVAIQHQQLSKNNGHHRPDGSYLADALTDRTIQFIKENQDAPWCAYLAHFGVHTPLDPKKDLLPKYEAKKPGELHHHVVMATMIQAIDDSVGRLVAELERLGERDNTVIVFSSDNGGYGPATDMDPLWGYKGTYFEGGIRVPLFINWPGVVAPGKSSAVPVIATDLYPTFCDIAAAPLPDQPVDGRSLLTLLRGEIGTFGQRPIFWHFPAYLESYSNTGEQRDPLFRARPVAAVRTGDFKLKEYYEDGHLALYNLKDDIREQRNLAGEMPEKRDELLRILHRWQDELGATRPSQPNPEFDQKAELDALGKARKSFAPALYPFQNGVDFGSVEEAVSFIKDLGYQGVGSVYPKDLLKFKTACDKEGLKVFSIYTGGTVSADGFNYGKEVGEAITMLKGTDALVELNVQRGTNPNDGQATAFVKEIAIKAKAAGLKVVLYPHANFHIERIDHALEIAKATGCDNVGVAFNLCHFLKVQPTDDLSATLKAAKPLLWSVSTCGADAGETDWSTLIRPLDEGTFDQVALLRHLRDLGFNGPLGLQCYNITIDPRQNLERSMEAWKNHLAGIRMVK